MANGRIGQGRTEDFFDLPDSQFGSGRGGDDSTRAFIDFLINEFQGGGGGAAGTAAGAAAGGGSFATSPAAFAISQLLGLGGSVLSGIGRGKRRKRALRDIDVGISELRGGLDQQPFDPFQIADITTKASAGEVKRASRQLSDANPFVSAFDIQGSLREKQFERLVPEFGRGIQTAGLATFGANQQIRALIARLLGQKAQVRLA